MDGRWIFDNLCTLLLSLPRWFVKESNVSTSLIIIVQRCIMGRLYIYIFERPTESLTLLDIRFNVTQNAGRRCYWISEIRNDHVSMLLGKCIKSKVNKSDSSWFTIIYPLFQPL